MGTLRLA
ncbi:hypothetical protein SAMN04488117_10168 [Celeribacter baekdonensis]|nr:hypothetical protein SAMN04488117_10168 [Celeribacter baekdonensis]